MRRLAAVAVAALLLAGGCSAVRDLSATHCPASRKLLPQGAIDYIDFVQVGGIPYHADSRPESGRALRDGGLGGQVAVVRCKLADHIVEDPAQRYLDGDAAYLDKGTALYAVKGYRPTFRLAGRDGEMVLFEAAENPRARTWGDLLDAAGKVRWIGVNDGSNRPLATLRDRQQVARLRARLVPDGLDPAPPTTVEYQVTEKQGRGRDDRSCANTCCRTVGMAAKPQAGFSECARSARPAGPARRHPTTIMAVESGSA
jgi:hypothetical protein